MDVRLNKILKKKKKFNTQKFQLLTVWAPKDEITSSLHSPVGWQGDMFIGGRNCSSLPCEEDAFICCSECAVWQCYHHTAVDSQCGCIIFFDGFKLTEFQSLLCLRELAQNKAKRKRGLSKKNARAAKKPRVGSLNRIDTYFGRVSHWASVFKYQCDVNYRNTNFVLLPALSKVFRCIVNWEKRYW